MQPGPHRSQTHHFSRGRVPTTDIDEQFIQSLSQNSIKKLRPHGFEHIHNEFLTFADKS